MPSFQCATCGASFDVPDAKLMQYPGWTPRYCMQHRGGRGGGSKFQRKEPLPPRDPNEPIAITRLPPASAYGAKTFRSSQVGSSWELKLTPDEVLERITAGPRDGVFTDGGCDPNPGPGAWGFVWVADGEILAQGCDGERLTTNNRMEMSAICEALAVLPVDAKTTIYSDSQLCVKTLNEWAKSWKANGWRKKTGEVKNLDLVQEAYDLLGKRPGVKVQWIKAHDGTRWNEYCDALCSQMIRQLQKPLPKAKKPEVDDDV